MSAKGNKQPLHGASGQRLGVKEIKPLIKEKGRK